MPVQVTGGEARMVMEDGQEAEPNALIIIGNKEYSLDCETDCTYSGLVDLPDSTYQAQVVTESIAPISFVFN